jgi:hypothetical protein
MARRGSRGSLRGFSDLAATRTTLDASCALGVVKLSRIFLSHSSANNREAIALKQWLAKQNPRLANDIFLDTDLGTGVHIGQRWREALNQAAARCEGVVCLLSTNWESSEWCRWEYTYALELGKRIFVALLEPDTGAEMLDWQQCKLFGDGQKTPIDVGDGHPVLFATEGCIGSATGYGAQVSVPIHSSGPSTIRTGHPIEVGSRSSRSMRASSAGATRRSCGQWMQCAAYATPRPSIGL